MVIVYGLLDRTARDLERRPEFAGVLFWPRHKPLNYRAGAVVVLMVRFLHHKETYRVQSLYPRHCLRVCRGCAGRLLRELALVRS